MGESTLAEQQQYYRALAPDYHRTVMPESSADAAATEEEVKDRIDRLCRGDVLELACGPGTWTSTLARRARTLTCIDGAPEMIAIAAAANPGKDVTFVNADLFTWQPTRTFDAIFFGFWLSHVPEDQFAPFWARLARGLVPDGRVLFVDDAYRPTEELAYGTDSSLIRRVLKDGSRHRIVKAAHTAASLSERLVRLGWNVELHEHGRYFWGLGAPSR